MNITLKHTKDHVELVKAMASNDIALANKAQLAVAEFIEPVLNEVINKAPTVSNLFTTETFNEDSSPSLPLDLYSDIETEDHLRIWSQTQPGGLATNMVLPPQQELKFMTYSLDSAYGFEKKYARQSRLGVVGKTFTRMLQEVMIKEEKTTASLIMSALANATTNGSKHVFRTGIKGRFLPDDLNKLRTLSKRINSAWNRGTPETRVGRGFTDLILSPEMIEEIYGMAYNPINTKGGVYTSIGTPSNTTAGDAAIAAPDSVREQMFNASGLSEFMGVSLMEINELGVGQRFNDIFVAKAGTTTYADNYATPKNGGSAQAIQSDEEIILAIDLGRDSLFRMVAVDADKGSQFTVSPDNQFIVDRRGKIGFYGGREAGHVILDDRVLTGLIS